MKTARFTSVAASVLLVCLVAQADKPVTTGEPSLEDLLNVEVEIVSRRAEPVSETASAVSVITGDEIRRSGFQTLPDILRLANGVNVARQNGNSWSVSADSKTSSPTS